MVMIYFLLLHLVNKISRHNLNLVFFSLLDGKSYKQQSHSNLKKNQLQLILYISLPLLVMISALVINKSKLSRLCDREISESDRYLLDMHIYVLLLHQTSQDKMMVFIKCKITGNAMQCKERHRHTLQNGLISIPKTTHFITSIPEKDSVAAGILEASLAF